MLLARLAVKQVLVAGLSCMAAGQLWLAQISPGVQLRQRGAARPAADRGGHGTGLPTASIAITSGVPSSEQGVAGALFTSRQQTGAAILASATSARTVRPSGSPAKALTAGYRLSFLIATAILVLAAALVAVQLSSRSCQQELNRQRPAGGVPPSAPAEAQLRKC